MPSIDFLFVVHNHQPVGNFDFVLERAYERSYAPFLEVLARHPGVRIGLHVSGCLLDWIRAHRPEYVDRVGTLAARGQVELLTGGYYEPILTGLPERDVRGQVEKLTGQVEAWGGRRPEGLWLAERVWEPGLASRLSRAGVRYTFVDENHFLQAGAEPDALDRVYITEDEGYPLRVFPISRRLRYLIPFQAPEETLAHLRSVAARGPGRMVLFGDDGEKFGLWPHTHDTVYGEGWLERFFTLLERNGDWIRMLLPRQAAEREPGGKIYLPSTSYEEMSEWVLPPRAQLHLREVRARLRGAGEDRNGTAFLPGGLWRNFFVRYPESDHLHARVLDLGRRVEEADLDEERRRRARDLIWSAECNCAYWHGVFGGLYLPHLRDALYRRLLEAERTLEESRPRRRWTDVRVLDLEEDGREETILTNPRLTLVLEPHRGGALRELSLKEPVAALGNGLTRRREAYHEMLSHAVYRGDGDDEAPRSIHDRVVAKEPGLAERLQIDRYRRASLMDHFLRSDADPDRFHRGTAGEQGDFLEGEYVQTVSRGNHGVRVRLRREGHLWAEGHPRSLALEKSLLLPPGRAAFRVDYALENRDRERIPVRFAVEWNLSMLSPDSPDATYRIRGVPAEESRFGSRGATAEVPAVELRDGPRRFTMRMRFSEPALLWRMPVETINLSEDGFERVYQMSCLLPIWRWDLAPGERKEVSLEIDFRSLGDA